MRNFEKLFAALKELLSLGNEKKSKLSFCNSLAYA